MIRYQGQLINVLINVPDICCLFFLSLIWNWTGEVGYLLKWDGNVFVSALYGSSCGNQGSEDKP